MPDNCPKSIQQIEEDLFKNSCSILTSRETAVVLVHSPLAPPTCPCAVRWGFDGGQTRPGWDVCPQLSVPGRCLTGISHPPQLRVAHFLANVAVRSGAPSFLLTPTDSVGTVPRV